MTDNKHFSFRNPDKRDGEGVWRLIADCPPLDQNSLYCNLLQCTHFADTCIVAEREGEIMGWVSAYRPPDDPEAIFVWQVAVHEKARGSGLGKSLLKALLECEGAKGATTLKTTITKSNDASWALFRATAAAFDAPLKHEEWLNREADLAGRYASEHLVTIGPFGSRV